MNIWLVHDFPKLLYDDQYQLDLLQIIEYLNQRILHLEGAMEAKIIQTHLLYV